MTAELLVFFRNYAISSHAVLCHQSTDSGGRLSCRPITAKYLFLSRVSILMRDIDIAINLSVCLSVCPSVRNVPVSDENSLTYRHNFFHLTVAESFCFYQHQTSSRNSDEVTPCGGAKCRKGIKISRFSTNESLYLANDAIYRHSYYRRRIGNRTQAFE